MRMTRRDVVARYRGSFIGLAWSFFNPVLLLIVYTFVFAVVFKARWGDSRFGADGDGSLAVMIFSGMIVHALFSECFIRSPDLITSNSNFVKRVIFPLEVLPWVSMGSAIFHLFVSLLVLVGGQFIASGSVHATVLLAPLALAPLMLFTMGVSWFVSAAGVYFRDLAQASGIISIMMLFLSPVFYPLSIVPEDYRAWFYVNPLTYMIELLRELVVFGSLPPVGPYLLYCAASLAVACLGYAWFQKTRRGFADVL
ncbi:MAG: ABC transporter permease [Halioglobus sp.]|nr:ABC transporter permease [Halioglobus sp.]